MAEINDKRLQKEFSGISFSKYKKADVKKQLIKNITAGKVEESCYWSIELICAGHFLELWEIIIQIMGKHIHVGNPKLPIYLSMKFESFREIITGGYVNNELKMRNNPHIRKLFAEVICVLCLSSKKHSYNNVKIEQSDFDITNLGYKLKAPNVDYGKQIFRKDDPKELFMAVNELAYHISSDSYDNLDATYWIEWIILFESLCKKKKDTLQCERRTFCPVDDKQQMDISWLLWDIILNQAQKRSNFYTKIVNCLIELFAIKYTRGCMKKRKHLYYFAISLLTENHRLDVPLLHNKSLVESLSQKIDVIYMQVKKNEETPSTDYLFKGLNDDSNLEKSLTKLDLLNQTLVLPRK